MSSADASQSYLKLLPKHAIDGISSCFLFFLLPFIFIAMACCALFFLSALAQWKTPIHALLFGLFFAIFTYSSALLFLKIIRPLPVVSAGRLPTQASEKFLEILASLPGIKNFIAPIRSVVITTDNSIKIIDEPSFLFLGKPRKTLYLSFNCLCLFSKKEMHAILLREFTQHEKMHKASKLSCFELHSVLNKWRQIERVMKEFKSDITGELIYFLSRWINQHFAVKYIQLEESSINMCLQNLNSKSFRRALSSALFKQVIFAPEQEVKFWERYFEQAKFEKKPSSSPYEKLMESFICDREKLYTRYANQNPAELFGYILEQSPSSAKQITQLGALPKLNKQPSPPYIDQISTMAKDLCEELDYLWHRYYMPQWYEVYHTEHEHTDKA